MGQKRPAVVMEPGSVPSAGFQRIQQKQPVQPQSGRKSRIPVLEGFRLSLIHISEPTRLQIIS